jgi:hypothetical protein
MTHANSFRRTVLGFVLAGGAVLAATPRAALAEDRAPHVPTEVYAACSSKSEGNACSVEVGARGFQGVCALDHGAQRLACRPAPPRPRS